MILDKELTSLDFSEYTYPKDHDVENLISLNATSEDYDLLSLISALPGIQSIIMKNVIDSQKTEWLSASMASIEAEKCSKWKKSVDATDTTFGATTGSKSLDQCFSGISKKYEAQSYPPALDSNNSKQFNSCFWSHGWTEEEQQIFYDIMQNVSLTNSDHIPNNASLMSNPPIIQSTISSCFKLIEKKLERKSIDQIGSYYESLTKHIQCLFEKIACKFDSSDSTQSLIAVQCWSMLHSGTSDKLKESIRNFSEAQVAQILAKMIDKSHGQMIDLNASMCHNGFFAGNSRSSVFSGSPSETRESSKNKQIDFEQNSFFRRSPTCVEHYPPVRRKRQRQAPTKPVESAKKSRQLLAKQFEIQSGENCKIMGVCMKEEVALSDRAQNSSKQKMAIKIRMIPVDESTKRFMAKCGLNPKVELKVSSTKRILHVLHHMQKKWDVVHSTHSNLASCTLCFYPDNERRRNAWDETDIKIDENSELGRIWTCFQLWRKWGETDCEDNIIQLLYGWENCNPTRIKQNIVPSKQAGDSTTSKVDMREGWSLTQDDFKSSLDVGLPSLASLHPAFPSSNTAQAQLPERAPAKPKIDQSRGNLLTRSERKSDLQSDTSKIRDGSLPSHRRRIIPTLIPKQEFDI